MNEETKKKLSKYGKLALGAALLGGAAYGVYKNKDAIADHYRGVKDAINDTNDIHKAMQQGKEAMDDAQHHWDAEAKATDGARAQKEAQEYWDKSNWKGEERREQLAKKPFDADGQRAVETYNAIKQGEQAMKDAEDILNRRGVGGYLRNK